VTTFDYVPCDDDDDEYDDDDDDDDDDGEYDHEEGFIYYKMTYLCICIVYVL
jgi:hypothetical protein